MEQILQSIVIGFPILIYHLGLTVALFGLGLYTYVKVTPLHEFNLVRDGNQAAGLSLSGVIIGLALPLAFSMKASVNGTDIVFWGIVIVILQLSSFLAAHLLLSDLSKRIENGEMAAAWLLFGLNIALAMFIAAAISG